MIVKLGPVTFTFLLCVRNQLKYKELIFYAFSAFLKTEINQYFSFLQLIEIITKCWLNDLPPSSSELVLQLTDPVTETEL